jgi:hypothetical protein
MTDKPEVILGCCQQSFSLTEREGDGAIIYPMVIAATS